MINKQWKTRDTDLASYDTFPISSSEDCFQSSFNGVFVYKLRFMNLPTVKILRWVFAVGVYHVVWFFVSWSQS